MAAVEGDQPALDALLRRHVQQLHALCRRLLASEADAADATQEALIAIVRGLPRFDRRSAFTTWAYRVTTNACLDELRRRRRRPEPLGEEAVEEARTRAAHAQGTPTDQIADRVDIDRALASLAMEFRVAVVLRDLTGLDYAEIAEILGVPTGTVKSRIARGRRALSDLLTASGNPPGGFERQTGRP